jgi:hypothetical protein
MTPHASVHSRSALGVLAAVAILLTLPATAVADSYLIQLTGSGPANLSAAVERSGGVLTHSMPEIGYAGAISDDPSFARNLANESGVMKVHLDMEVQWVPGEIEAGAGDAPGALGHVTPPASAFFFPCQWNMTQVDAPGAWALGEFGAGSTVAVLDTARSPRPASPSRGSRPMPRSSASRS